MRRCSRRPGADRGRRAARSVPGRRLDDRARAARCPRLIAGQDGAAGEPSAPGRPSPVPDAGDEAQDGEDEALLAAARRAAAEHQGAHGQPITRDQLRAGSACPTRPPPSCGSAPAKASPRMPVPRDQPGRGIRRAVTLCTGVAAAGPAAPGQGAVAARRGAGRGFPGRERLVTFPEGAPAAAPGAQGWPLPVVRDADPGDTGPVLAVYRACIAADPGYLPFLAPGDESSVLAWFRLKPLLVCLVAELDGTVAGVAGLRDAEPGPGAGEAGGRWLEACRLAVHPACRGGAVTRDLVSGRASRAVALGADRHA